MPKDRAVSVAGRGAPRRSTGTPVLSVLLTGFCLAWTAQPCAGAAASVQLAQGAADMLELGKKALGLGKNPQEGSAQTGIENGVPFLVHFRDTVGSLELGAPVLVRGMRMGAVRDVRVTFDLATTSFDIPVVIELDPAPFTAGESIEAAAEATKRVHAAIAALVRNGLRAELTAANLFPGALAVALEVRPETAPAELLQGQGGLPEIPTTGAPVEPLAAKLERVAARVSAIPLERTVAELDGLVAAARRLVDDPALLRLLANLAEASEALAPAARRLDPMLRAAADLAAQPRATMAKTQVLLERSRTLPHELDRALGELTNAARSMRLLTEMLERQLEAILRGKGG